MIPDTEQKHLFQHYFSDNYSYDELQGDDGNLRPHWQTFFQSFSQLGRDEILTRNQDVLRFLKENGVTYNIYGDPAGQNRPWNLDLIPFLISKQEWQVIESGLKQRAELFNHILKDIYGERRLIKNGLLPMELVYEHTGFLRQCVGIPLKDKRSLVVYSADMARCTDGKIWILNDRTQAPSGSGYALENRMAMARILPELFDGFKVRRLSSYFNSLRNALVNSAAVQKNDPRIVILTPGPENETYFEHSYLSSYLGFILAQGDDLMVKDNYVFLKTIGGLEKVDVILRRVDDIYCDPLELLENSQLGVPGLLQAVRSGNVRIANPLGSSILENPGFMPFMQGISKYFLGEELIMPNIASWWCGQPAEMDYVLENIGTLVIKRIYRDTEGHTSKDGTSLSKAELNDLKGAIKAHPNWYVGQEKVSISPTPSLINGTIEPRRAIFRSFAVSNTDEYTIMTGGLTRTSAEKGNFIISNQLGGISKDTWIISPETGNNFSARKEKPVAEAVSTINKGVITSHIAENLFWVGRYAERVLGNARFQRTVMQFISEGDRRMADSEGITEGKLLEALTQCSFTYPGFAGKDGKTLLEHPLKELREILIDPVRIGSIHYNIQMFKNAVYAVRDHWSTDTWRVLREMEECFNEQDTTHTGFNGMIKILDSLITFIMAFISLNRESISREQGWNLLDAGRKTEQSLLLVNMLKATLVAKQDEQVEYNLMEAVLKSHECLVNYRYKYRAHLQLSLVLDLMLLDPNNPRSLVYQLDRLKAYLSQLPKLKDDNELAEHERLVLEAHTFLRLSSKDDLIKLTKENYNHLDEFLKKMQSLLSAIQAVVSKTYFKHAQAQKQLFSLDSL